MLEPETKSSEFKIFEVFDENCTDIPTQESAFKLWLGSLFNDCTILAELGIFLILCLVGAVFFFLFWRRRWKRTSDSFPRRLFYVVASAFVTIACAYFLLALISLIGFSYVIKGFLLSPPAVICPRKYVRDVLEFKPRAYILEKGDISLAVLKIPRNSTGYLSEEKVTVFYTYGKGDTLMEEIRNLTLLAKSGLEVYSWDLPGYGSSPGPPPEAARIVEAHQIALDFVAQDARKPKPDILLWGHSMGGAISVLGAAKAKSKKLILHNPLDAMELVATDACRMTGRIFAPIMFGGYLEIRPSLLELADGGSCLLMYSSRKDQLIPFSRQRRLYDSFASRAKRNCSIFNENPYQVHDRSPWVDQHFPDNLKKFLGEDNE